jgi:hypothetical protein
MLRKYGKFTISEVDKNPPKSHSWRIKKTLNLWKQTKLLVPMISYYAIYFEETRVIL